MKNFLLAFAIVTFPFCAFAKEQKADLVIYNGAVFSAAAQNNANAIAIKNGRIIYIGDDIGALKLAGRKTQKINAAQNTIMPGIIDAHMHPQSGGLKMTMCSLNYEALDIKQMNARIQKCLDEEKNAGENDWLVVINWYEQQMLPIGYVPNYKDFAQLKTKRPIYIKNSFGHAGQLNGRGMEIVDLANQKERTGGIIVRDKDGKPTGRLEEAAKDIVSEILPQPNEAKNLKAAQMAVSLMNSQGITSILDAYTDIETMQAYKQLKARGELTIRPHFAVLIDPDKEADNAKSVAEVIRQKSLFDEKDDGTKPVLKVHSAKMFLDGVIAMPSLTGNMIAPYFENHGSDEHPHWRPSGNYGPKPYINLENLTDLMVRLAKNGIDAHMHADGDGAVRLALDAAQALNEKLPNHGTRPAIAHAEIVDPADFGRFAQTGALPVLSFQWGKPAADTWEGTKDVLGPYRHAIIEPQGLLDIYGARVVFGSDWPVDPLNEWLALEVALTRMADGDERAKYPMRLGIDPALNLETALKAMTINAAYSLHSEKETGSLELGKYGDIIILDRDLFKTKPDDISQTKVKITILGGQVVYKSE